ncbi:protein kinase [Actinosynnema sp. NPDC047251]|uniref:serine/threonine-protein kinase n=1 Tax=Saccharothrix espanaensis TaxID=103731 RepID=UPI0002F6357D|nr:serine/threonine-protein kinase [Saccharothrix espanaensis]
MDERTIAGRYRLTDRIGAGGMGVVWRAEDTRLRRIVAVKELLTRNGFDADSAKRAVREGRIAARLQHANVIALYDVVEDDDRPWLVMEYLPSRSLAAVLADRGTLTHDEVRRIGQQLAAGLASAHDAGVIHRDVKPGNVLVTEFGTVKVTDFGTSRVAGEGTLTASGMLVGTPAYLAPEVALGAEPGFPSDVFGVGATLYAALEGAPPFGVDGNPILLLHRAAEGKYPPPENAGPLGPVLARLLDRDPENRPTMAEAVRMLAEGSAEPVTVVAEALPFAAATRIVLPVLDPPAETGPSEPLPAPAPPAEPAATAADEQAAGLPETVPPLAPPAVPIPAADAPAGTTVSAEPVATNPATTPAEADPTDADPAGTDPAETDSAETTPAKTKPATLPVATTPATPPAKTKVATPPVEPPPAGRPDGESDGVRRRVVLIVAALVVLLGVVVVVLLSHDGETPLDQPGGSTATGATQPTGQDQPTGEQPTGGQPTSGQDQPTGQTTQETTQETTTAPPTTTTPAQPTGPDQALTDYYALLPGNTEVAYTRLTDRFKAGRTLTPAKYRDFWSRVASAPLSEVRVDGDKVTARVTYNYRGGGSESEVNVYTLVRVGDGWAIDQQDTIG